MLALPRAQILPQVLLNQRPAQNYGRENEDRVEKIFEPCAEIFSMRCRIKSSGADRILGPDGDVHP